MLEYSAGGACKELWLAGNVGLSRFCGDPLRITFPILGKTQNHCQFATQPSKAD